MLLTPLNEEPRGVCSSPPPTIQERTPMIAFVLNLKENADGINYRINELLSFFDSNITSNDVKGEEPPVSGVIESLERSTHVLMEIDRKLAILEQHLGIH